jgi:hypothetical protein
MFKLTRCTFNVSVVLLTSLFKLYSKTKNRTSLKCLRALYISVSMKKISVDSLTLSFTSRTKVVLTGCIHKYVLLSLVNTTSENSDETFLSSAT